MKRSVAVAAILLLLCLSTVAAVAGSGLAGAQSTSTTISTSVNGRAVAAGGSVVVGADPNVTVAVESASAVQTLVVRVNGDTVDSSEPGTSTVSRHLAPHLEEGSNTVEVVVKTADGSVTSRRLDVTMDDQAPFIRFTSPFETSYYRDVIPDTTRVNESAVVVSGELHDASNVERVTIERKYHYYQAHDRKISNARWDVVDPGNSFSKRIFLGNGTNELVVRVVDSLGHVRVYDTDVVVTDNQAPQVTLSVPATTHRSTLHLDGRVTDNVQLDAVTIGIAGRTSTRLFDGIDQQPDESAVAVPLSGTLPLHRGENKVVVTATDVAGNTIETSTTVVYERTIVPAVDFDRNGTRFLDDGTLQVSGRVTDGEITGVTVESDAVSSGDVVDLTQVYAGPDVKREVNISSALALADGPTRIVVRATDSKGAEHRFAFTADPDAQTITWGSTPTGAGSTSTPTGGTDTTTAAGDGTAAGPADGSNPTTAPSADAALPGFTPVTAFLALAMLAALAAVRRRRDR